MLTLQVEPAQGDAFKHHVETDDVVIGRASSCDLVLADRYLSRRHARLINRDGRWLVEDLGSRNGTLLNGHRLDNPAELRDHDVLQLSASLITVIAGGEDDAARPAEQHSTTGSIPSATILRPASDLLAHSGLESEATATPAELRRYASRLRLLNDVHHALSRPIQLQELLDLILDRAFEQLQPEEGAVWLKTPDGGVERAASKSTLGREAQFLESTTLVNEVIEKGLAALVLDTDTDERFGTESILTTGVRSLVAAPLADPEGCLGMIALNSRLHRRQFKEDDLELLASLASVASLRIRNLGLVHEAEERRRLEEEIRLARQIQLALLPREMPEIPGFEILGRNLPSRTVSGDFFEIVERKDGAEYALLLADVSGKGVAAALLTASVEALVATPIEDGLPPEEIFTRVSRNLHRRTSAAKYATAWLGILERESGRLGWTNAGHMPALIIRSDGRTERLEPDGFPIGMIPGATYERQETFLEAGDTLLVYSDGITEAENAQGEEYGIDRLEVTCRALCGQSTKTVSAAIERDLDEFTGGALPADDRTVLLLHRPDS
jgi:sigma-B regulation protein RsbU (phosphoserine phosphatase)